MEGFVRWHPGCLFIGLFASLPSAPEARGFFPVVASTSAGRGPGTSKGVNNELSHQDPGQVPSLQGRSRLPPGSRLDGAHLFVLWVSEMVFVRGGGTDSFYQQRPSDFLDVPCFRHAGGHLVFWGFGVSDWCALVPGLLA